MGKTLRQKMAKPVPMFRRSSAVITRPSNRNSSNIRARHVALISGMLGCSVRTTSTMRARADSFKGNIGDKGELLREVNFRKPGPRQDDELVNQQTPELLCILARL